VWTAKKKIGGEVAGLRALLDPFCMIFSVLPLVRRMDYPLDYPAQHDCVLVAISWTRFPFPAS